MRRLRSAIPVLALLLATTPARAATFTDLGSPVGYELTDVGRPLAINDAGTIVAGFKRSATTEPFRHDGSTWVRLANAPPGPFGSTPVDINDREQIALQASCRGFLWTAGILTEILPDVPTTCLRVAALNIRGQVVGEFTAGSVGNPLPFLWQPTSPNATTGTFLPLSLPPAARYAQANDINAAGVIVGKFGGPGDPTNPLANYGHAFVWTPSEPNGSTGAARPLWPIGERFGNAVAVDDAGRIVGQSYTPTSTWHSFVWRDGLTTALTLLPGFTYSTATDINGGVIVGHQTVYQGSKFVDRSAVVWTTNGVTPLPGPPAPYVSFPLAINASGQIAGSWGELVDQGTKYNRLGVALWTE